MRAGMILLFALAAAAPAQLQDVRGTNYLAHTYACADILLQFQPNDAAIPGTYVPAAVEAELARIREAGFTSIRVFGSFHGWLLDRDGHARALADLLARSARHGLSVAFVLWNGFGSSALEAALRDPGFDPKARLRPGLLFIPVPGTPPPGPSDLPSPVRGAGGFHAAPGNGLLRDFHAVEAHPHPGVYEAWVSEVAGLFRLHPGTLLCYDLFNEAEVAIGAGAAPGAIEELIAWTARLLARIHPGAPLVAGCATIDGAVEVFDRLRARHGLRLSALSFHPYMIPSLFEGAVAKAAREAARRGVPALASEFHMPAAQGGLHLLLHFLERAGVGGQMWGYLEDRLINAWTSFPEPRWVPNSGVVRLPAPGIFEVKNAPFEGAVRSWASGREPFAIPLRVRASVERPTNTTFVEVVVAIEGPPGLPLLLLVSPRGPGEEAILLPALGALHHLGPRERVTVLPLPPLDPGPAGPGRREIREVILEAVRLQGLVFSAQVLTGDYSLPSWETSTAQLSAPAPLVF